MNVEILTEEEAAAGRRAFAVLILLKKASAYRIQSASSRYRLIVES